jgi:pyruvate/2-oxoglutarate dehydrogenase complex dihydrolipoamide dehydrogenase (E3) component
LPGTEEFYSCDTLLLSCGLIPENELSKQAGITLSRVTGGPEVDDGLETSAEGVFACGNVLHVHDLVDFVSEEAARAGRNAAARVAEGGRNRGGELPVTAENGVTYTVPQRIRTDAHDEKITVRFRVNGVYRDKYVAVRSGGTEIKRLKRRIMAPGEMEELTLTGENLGKCAGGITVGLED